MESYRSKMIALIPARAGSKGVPNKNKIEILGVSLTHRAVNLAKKSGFFNRIYISTDDDEIYALSKSIGASLPTKRAPHLSGDNSRTIDLLFDLMERGLVSVDDFIMLLQPTSPFRSLSQLKEVVDKIVYGENSDDCVVSVEKIIGDHPQKAFEIKNKRLVSLFGVETSYPRQLLRESFRANGAFYFGRVATFIGENSFVPKNNIPYFMDEYSSINIDTMLDYFLAQKVVEMGLVDVALEDSKI